MSLENTLSEIKLLKPLAEEDTDVGPVETMSGRRGRKIQAINRLKVLRREYTSGLLRSALFIVTTGSQREEFEKIATGESFKLFSSDPETFYKDLANRVHPTLYTGKVSPSNLFDVLGRHLEDKMGELEVSQYNQMIFKDKYVQVISSPEDFTTLLKRAINEQIGAEIVGIQAATSITDTAIDSGHAAKITPIILSTNDEELVTDLLEDLNKLTPRVFLVLAGKTTKTLRAIEDSLSIKEPTEESVKSTFDQILKSIKK